MCFYVYGLVEEFRSRKNGDANTCTLSMSVITSTRLSGEQKKSAQQAHNLEQDTRDHSSNNGNQSISLDLPNVTCGDH